MSEVVFFVEVFGGFDGDIIVSVFGDILVAVLLASSSGCEGR